MHVWQEENIAKDRSIFGCIPRLFLLEKKGKPYQYIAISSDIEQKQAQKINNVLTDLKKTNKELDQFAYIVS
jgi:hypothetical protein